MLMQTVTMIITGLSMGITILVGQRIGARKPEEAGRAVGTGICLFAVFAVDVYKRQDRNRSGAENEYVPF